jgi:predicted  nucleic acid-binding Zn-ribbon protein
MTQVTDTDIREIKSAIDANTKSIATLSERVESIIKITESNAKAITDLTLEMRLGFANVENKFTKLEGRIDTANARLTSLESNTKAIADLELKLGTLE